MRLFGGLGEILKRHMIDPATPKPPSTMARIGGPSLAWGYEALVAALRRVKLDYIESELEISGGGKYDAGRDVGTVRMNRLQRAMDQIR